MMIHEAAFQWIMAHPWMTFFIALAVIEAIENIITSIFKAIGRARSNVTTSKDVEVTILDKDGNELL